MCLLYSCYALYLFVYERLLYLKHMQLLSMLVYALLLIVMVCMFIYALLLIVMVCMLVYALLLNHDGCVEEVIGVHKGPAFSYLSVLFTQRSVL